MPKIRSDNKVGMQEVYIDRNNKRRLKVMALDEEVEMGDILDVVIPSIYNSLFKQGRRITPENKSLKTSKNV